MNCPVCGRFMRLIFAIEAKQDVAEAPWWWECSQSAEDCTFRGVLPAHEYSWFYNCADIPEEAFVECPELKRECEEMKKRGQRKGFAIP